MTIDTAKIAKLVASIESIKKIIQKGNEVVTNEQLTNFTECLQTLELNLVTYPVPKLEFAVNDLFEKVYTKNDRNKSLMKDQNLMYILVLLIINKIAKTFALKTIKYWTMFIVCIFYLSIHQRHTNIIGFKLFGCK